MMYVVISSPKNEPKTMRVEFVTGSDYTARAEVTNLTSLYPDRNYYYILREIK